MLNTIAEAFAAEPAPALVVSLVAAYALVFAYLYDPIRLRRRRMKRTAKARAYTRRRYQRRRRYS